MKNREWLTKVTVAVGGVACIMAIVEAIKGLSRLFRSEEEYYDEDDDDMDFDDFDEDYDDAGAADAAAAEDQAQFRQSLTETLQVYYDKGFHDGIWNEYHGENPAAQAMSDLIRTICDEGASLTGGPVKESLVSSVEEIKRLFEALRDGDGPEGSNDDTEPTHGVEDYADE